MTKSTRTLSGAAKNTFLDGIVRSALGDDHAARERLMQELMVAVASLRIRIDAERALHKAGEPIEPQLGIADDEPEALSEAPSAAPFDPYSPNVIVLLRTKGRDAALTALATITDAQNLRLLAHEQQLGVPQDPLPLIELRTAIVAAAERRIANRQAAGR